MSEKKENKDMLKIYLVLKGESLKKFLKIKEHVSKQLVQFCFDSAFGMNVKNTHVLRIALEDYWRRHVKQEKQK